MSNWPEWTDEQRLGKVKAALTKTKGNVSKTAEALSVSRQTITTFLGLFGDKLGLHLSTLCPHCGKNVPLRRRAGARKSQTTATPPS